MIASTIFLGAIGPGSWVVIGIAILLLFGGKKIPELMKGLGGGVKEFKNAMKEEDENKNSKKDETITKE